MKKKMVTNFIACLIVSVLFCTGAFELQAEDFFITIGGGDFSGVYFPTGLAIADMVNNRRHDYGIRATIESTTGSTFNLNAVMAGYLEFGLIQSDIQYLAVKGLASWEKKGPQKELRAVFSLYPESVTLVAAVDAGIDTIADLKGKKVSLGSPGSSQLRIVFDALEAVGLDPKKIISPQTVTASDAPTLLQDNRIDAYFFTVGHPSETTRRALSNERKARIIPITGPDIDKLVAENSHYTKTRIEMQRLYPDLEGHSDNVNTFGVVATLCTSSKIPEEVVYALTKVVFENLDGFRRQHPALGGLTKKGMLEGLSAPLHPGAIKYFREVGLM